MGLPSFKMLLYAFVFVYMLYIPYSIWSLAQLFAAPPCIEGEPCIPSFLEHKPNLQLLVYKSEETRMRDDYAIPLFQSNLGYNYPQEWVLDVPVPKHVLKNGDIYLHILVVPYNHKSWPWIRARQEKEGSYVRVKLTQMQYPSAASYKLLDSNSKTEKTAKEKGKQKETKVNHIKKKVVINMMLDESPLPEFNLPPEMAGLFRMSPNNEFLPILQYDFLGTRLKDLEQLRSDTTSANVTLMYSPVSFGKMRFRVHVEASMHTLRTLGFSDKDLDEVKGIFADTNLYLLCITVFISALHLLFDFLAFKNDVSFWRVRSNLTGLSVRAVLWRTFSQIVVFFYLLDEDTSLLVLIPSGVGTLIELWKAQKVVSISFVRKSWGPWLQFQLRGSSKEEQITQQLDAEAMRYLTYLLYPLCIIGAIYSLIYEPHRSWYSWTINSLVNGVYAFGFLFMLPQLFINYRLKSVAHLPWRAFMYKAFNTFIDDMFAFIITMPTSHRVACFRDDIVFLVYLYQRWLYPVDKSRRDGSVTMEDEHTTPEEDKKEK